MQEDDPLFKAATDQFKMIRKGLATRTEQMAARDNLSLDVKTMIACYAKLSERIKILEKANKDLKEKQFTAQTKGQDE